MATTPARLAGLQGVQEAEWEGHPDAAGNVQRHFKGFKAGTPGSMTPAEYDQFVRDTVTFLAYIGEPAQLQRTALGFPVIAFLIFFAFEARVLD